MTRAQTRRLHTSLETFVRGLHGPRGKGKLSKFSGLTTAVEVVTQMRTVLEKRMRLDAKVAAKVEEAHEKRAAAFAKKRKEALTKK